MLTCDDLRERIPALEAGEPADGAERDHLASCESCRAEAARARADLARMRQELAVLAPSPFLEDRVVAIARDADAETTPARAAHPMRWAMGIGLAAAALLVAVVLLAHRPGPQPSAPDGTTRDDDALAESDGITNDGTGHAAEDGDADDGNADPGKADPGKADPWKAAVRAIAWPPTPREVDREARGASAAADEPGRPYTLPAAPRDGTAVLGRGLLARVRLAGARAASEAEHVQRAWAQLTEGGTRRTCSVSIADPRTKASAWCQATVDREYAGTLLVEEPLARAIGLHRGATPGAVRHEIVQPGTNTHWSTARAVDARVALVGSRALDMVARIQVREPGEPHAATPLWSGGLPGKPRIVLGGVLPQMGFVGTDVDVHWLHERWFVSADRNVPPPFQQDDVREIPLPLQEVQHVALEFRPSGGHELCYLYLPPLDVGGDAPVRTPLAWRVHLERIVLAQTFNPGAQITVAHAWRGHHAIPTRSGVAFTTADAQGRVSFVLARGERGPVRVHERLPGGSAGWRIVDIRRGFQSSATHQVVVARGKGMITTEHGVYDLEQGRMFVPAQPKGTAATRDEIAAALRAELKRAADAAGRTETYGTSRLQLTLVGMPTAAWSDVAFVLQVCAQPDVRIDRLAFANGSPQQTGTILPEDLAAVPYELPKDAGLTPRDPAKAPDPKIRIVIGSFGNSSDWWRASLTVPAKGREGQTQGASFDTLDIALRAMVARSGGAAGRLTIELVARPDAPFAKMQGALERARAQAPGARVLLVATARR